METGPVFEFGPFRYDARQRVLFRGGEVVPLLPKVADTLHVLVERHGQVVDKAELMKLIWPDAVVEEGGLARNISLLRKALGDEPEAATHIQTIPRRGYRFVAPLTATSPGGEPAPAAAASRRLWRWALAAALLVAGGWLIRWQFYTPSRYLPQSQELCSLAVIPFESLSPEPETAAAARVLSELLVAELSKREGVHVVSPSTVQRHRSVGNSMSLMARLLGLQVLVEGSIRRTPAGFQVSARLVDVHTGKLIWADYFDCSPSRSGAPESGLARAIAAQIGARIARAAR